MMLNLSFCGIVWQISSCYYDYLHLTSYQPLQMTTNHHTRLYHNKSNSNKHLNNDSDLNDLWTEIPKNELYLEFTDYELLSMEANQLILNESKNNLLFVPETHSQRLLDKDNKYQYLINSPISKCFIGSLSEGGGSKFNPGKNQCYKHKYNKKLKYFENRKPFTSHHIFWNLPNNSNIIFIGDSVQNQIFNGFECDIERNNHYPFWWHYKNGNIARIYNHKSSLNMNEFVRTNWSGIKYEMNENIAGYRYKFQNGENITLYSYYENGDIHIINLMYFRIYRPYIPMYIDSFCEWANIYIFQWELHYKPYFDQHWIRDIGNGIFKVLQSCFDKYSTLKNQPIFIWNEGSAQHFRKISGDYFDIYTNKENITNQYRKYIGKIKNDTQILINDTKWNEFYNSGFDGIQCEPHHYLKNKYWEKHIRRLRIMDFLNDNNYSFQTSIIDGVDNDINHFRNNTLYFIPFKDITDPLWDQHDNGDCTHWCSQPQLWQIIWDSMYRIISANI